MTLLWIFLGLCAFFAVLGLCFPDHQAQDAIKWDKERRKQQCKDSQEKN